MDYFEKVTSYPLFKAFMESYTYVKYIRHIFVDFSGITRQRIVTKEHCQRVYGNGRRYGAGPLLMVLNVSGTSEMGKSPKQQIFNLVPDWSSIRVCKFRPSHAWVMCFVYAFEEQNQFAQCPRFALAKVLERLERQAQASCLVGFETEFSLMDSSMQPLKSIDDMEGWATCSGLRDGKMAFLEEVVQTLQKSDIGVSHFHVESAHALEFATDPFPPMQAVDNLVYTQEVLRTIAIKHGYRATVSVLPVAETVTGVRPNNGCHVHFSISKDDETADHFLAGVLKRLSFITPFAMSTYDTYLNHPEFDPEGEWISWGTENRDVTIRGIERNHWELRMADGCATFHLLLAVLLNAALNGLEAKEPLTWKNMRYGCRSYTEAELAEYGVTERIPSTMGRALQKLRQSDEITTLLGAEMKQLYLLVKEKDCEALGQMTSEARRKQYIKYF